MKYLALAAPVFALLAHSGCGGCPWVQATPLEVTPATPCLALTFDVHEEHGGGCVNPVLLGHNSCGTAVTVPASSSTTGAAVTFQPDEDIVLEIPLESRTEPASHDGDDFEIPFTVGTDLVTVKFHTFGGID